ncbi:DNA gyrase inhibitor YacG [Thalassospira marina]|uniref:DNA gyrase inhibitor YacG n=1 Tax=Thalassospira marina TaxID=2048283 RepID=A0A2N3KRV8_9PROT|nr:DNA gyrase inhibitor YacG [Thalassospira marina]PKR53236.1 DNA gyrase inhibitor YacG [Thalassospira marina]
MASKPSASAKGTAHGSTTECAMCGAPVVEKYKPFCSKRCADLDLGKWLDASYAVPATEPPEYLEDLEDEDEF